MNILKKIKKHKIYFINDIIRCKNGWNDYKNNYCDLKLNVLVSYDNISIIAEIQFLLKFMGNFKIIAHPLYGIIYNIKNIKKELLDDKQKQIVKYCIKGNIKNIALFMLHYNIKSFQQLLDQQRGKAKQCLLTVLCENGHIKPIKIFKESMDIELFKKYLLERDNGGSFPLYYVVRNRELCFLIYEWCPEVIIDYKRSHK